VDPEENTIMAALQRRGFALALALCACFVLLLLLVSLSRMNSGLMNQVNHVEKRQKTFLIAYSAYSKVLAKIYLAPWNDRFFRSGGVIESGTKLYDGIYDCYVEDNPAKPYEADIYVRSEFNGLSMLYFWRIAFQDDILDVSNRLIPIYFSAQPMAALPPPGSKFGSTVDAILKKRRENADNASARARAVDGLTNVPDILKVMNGTPPGNVEFGPMMGTMANTPANPPGGLVPPTTLAAVPPSGAGSPPPNPNDPGGLPRTDMDAILKDAFLRIANREPKQAEYDKYYKQMMTMNNSQYSAGIDPAFLRSIYMPYAEGYARTATGQSLGEAINNTLNSGSMPPLPPGLSLPAGVPLPAGVSIPQGVGVPAGGIPNSGGNTPLGATGRP